MGALGRLGHRLGGRRVLLGAGLAMGVIVGVSACETGGLSTAAVAHTTDQAGTRELERQGADVEWLNCTASYDDSDGKNQSPSAGVDTVAKVDCNGETKDGKDITITGKVTREINGKCVRGDLTAKIAGKEWFQVNVLGNCNAPDPIPTPTPTPPTDDNSPGGPGPTVTVTVTKTVYCQSHPTCWPEGK
ncbi:hypothetical protein E0500_001040 [Streptomyces sp. KM273126]|uniref:hypothetical protein n=1 Tax=Streptomyces sp. KM273126 TaxID=2545247 RepID=UPI0015EC7D45|nr:hypothetical protein [Streptomyces sp. KM273126]